MTFRFPYPEIGGDSLRINNIASHLKKSGHRLFLLTFYGEKEPDLLTARRLYDNIVMIKHNSIEAAFFSVLAVLSGKPIQTGYYYSHRYMRALKTILNENIDIFIPHAMRLTEYIIRLGLESKTIVEQTDAVSKTYTLSDRGKGSFLKKVIYRIEKKLVPRYEEYMLRTFPKVVFVSPSDVKYLVEKYPWQRTAICHTNGFSVPKQVVHDYNPLKICIMGNMRTLQNQDAVFFFVEKVLPLISKKEPEVLLYIVGAEPPKRILNLSSSNIIITGFVEKIENEISNSCLCVAPVRIAAGIQNKVLVSMGCGVPIVMSSLISQPIPQLKNGYNCFIEDAADNIAEICIKLIRDKELRNAIGMAGRKMILDYYSWDKTLEGYEKI